MILKKIVLLATSCFMFSCSYLRPPAILLSNSLDYSEYQKDGFFITESNSVNFSYNPIGSVSGLNVAGYKIKATSAKVYSDDVFRTENKSSIQTTSEFIPATQTAVLAEMVKKAKEIGANSIINLNIKYFSHSDGKTSTSGYEGTGMAVKKI
jgi:uncharacterized protein YbjQ (UPF0145 family)